MSIGYATAAAGFGPCGPYPDLPPSVGEMLVACKSNENSEGVVVLPDAFVGVLDVKANIASDGIHPNELGYSKLAQNVLEQGLGMLKVVPSVSTPFTTNRQ